MTEEQQFALKVLALIPDGAVWSFRVHDDRFGSFMKGIPCVQINASEWEATIGMQERQKLLKLLQWDDEEGYWYFGGAESLEISVDGKRILRGFDGMEFVHFSKQFQVPEAFRLKYFNDSAGQVEDW